MGGVQSRWVLNRLLEWFELGYKREEGNQERRIKKKGDPWKKEQEISSIKTSSKQLFLSDFQIEVWYSKSKTKTLENKKMNRFGYVWVDFLVKFTLVKFSKAFKFSFEGTWVIFELLCCYPSYLVHLLLLLVLCRNLGVLVGFESFLYWLVVAVVFAVAVSNYCSLYWPFFFFFNCKHFQVHISETMFVESLKLK